jgi:hypothetical protein
MLWFRFYDEALNDPKVQRLPGDLFKTWVNLMCLASQNPERGYLPASMDDIAWALRVPVEDVRADIHTLQGQCLLDWVPECGCFYVHAWSKRQKASDDVTPRVQKHRARAADTDPPEPPDDETLHPENVKRFSNALDKSREDTEEIRIEESAADAATAQPEQEIKPKRKARIPKDYYPTDSTLAWARDKGYDKVLDLDSEIEEFTNYWRGRGEARLEWDASLKSHLIKRAGIVSSMAGGRNARTNRGRVYGSDRAGNSGEREPDPEGFTIERYSNIAS